MVCPQPSDTSLILASRSPRRQELLRQAGIRFELITPQDAEPAMAPGEDCREFARRAAIAKAQPVALGHPGRLVLGADTIVVLDGEALGKPGDSDEAREILARLGGRTHTVYTGVALLEADAGRDLRIRSDVAATAVTFRDLTAEEIDAYVGTGEPLDKAGAYGIQGLGGQLVASHQGSYTNVVGLPMEMVTQMLAACGFL